MQFFDANLASLKKNNVFLYEQLEVYINSKYDYKEDLKYKILDTKDGRKTVEVFVDSGNSIRLNSAYNASREADRWKKSFENMERITSVILLGYGNGIFFEKLYNKIDESAHIFIYEPDVCLFLYCMQNFDMTHILDDKRVHLYVDGINDRDLYMDLCAKTNWAMLPTQAVYIHPSYDRIYKEKCISFMNLIEKYKAALIAVKNTTMVYAKKFTVNAIKNLAFIKKSNYICEFMDKFNKDVPVIIVSAGPSLDKNIDELKMAEGKAFILSTDTAVKYLLEHDIKFDAIVTVDGRKSIRHLNDERCMEYPLFTVPDARSEVLEKNIGRKIWINGSGYLEALYKKYGYLFPEYVPGGSVATAAFWIAETIGAKTIILIGQDLAYDGNKTHAGNITYQYTGWEEKKDIYVESVNGEKVKTRADWLGYIRWFENSIIQLDDSTEVIDATEGGAKIKGTKIMSLSEVITNYCKHNFDFKEMLKDIPFTFNEDAYKKICRDIKGIIDEFDIIIKMSEAGKAAANRIISMCEKGMMDSNKININLERINKSEKIIQNQNIYLLLDGYIASEVAKRVERAAQGFSDENEKIYETVKSFKVLFEALIKACVELKPIIRETIKKL